MKHFELMEISIHRPSTKTCEPLVIFLTFFRFFSKRQNIPDGTPGLFFPAPHPQEASVLGWCPPPCGSVHFTEVCILSSESLCLHCVMTLTYSTALCFSTLRGILSLSKQVEVDESVLHNTVLGLFSY